MDLDNFDSHKIWLVKFDLLAGRKWSIGGDDIFCYKKTGLDEV